MPFGVVRGVGRGMAALDGDGDCRREGAVLGVNLGRPIVTNGAFATRSSQTTLRTSLVVAVLSSDHGDVCERRQWTNVQSVSHGRTLQTRQLEGNCPLSVCLSAHFTNAYSRPPPIVLKEFDPLNG